MEPLNHLESFVQSAEGGSFSAAARRLGLTPAAVSKNVARLEARLGVRLFQRSTRRLTLTEGGERFLAQIGGALATLQAAVAGIDKDDGQPAGTLKVSMGQAFGREHVLPMMGDFLTRYPAILPDWHFDNQQVDLVGEGFDAAIGGGIELSAGLVARELSRIHVVAVASPAYLQGRALPAQPADLGGLDTLLRRSSPTGRLRSWTLRHAASGEEATVDLPRPRAIFNDPEAIAHAALMGLGAAMLPMPFVERGLRSGELVRLLPEWHQDTGAVWLYYPSKKLLPPKTRVFIDFVLERFRNERFAQRMQVA
ncbi:LysR family transcriptional regulator [Variovorax sp. PAMC26660]|uniref:LysR family transcriptional regulator n=1 Tax=Variovorax sp. PAMC26660 TaxID=2762322 RepID=UPI00164D6100|nr:LysR family transcriptional regulator [Variovorax sp. PAMC26660]QNK70010.1 LysR family transcriptional regulator [Variovorax sp. PAMC26660]